MRQVLLLLTVLVVCLAACGPRAASSEAPAHPTAEWLLACRAGTGGFGWYPGDSAFTSCTGMALEALAELDELERLEGREALVAWLQERQQPDGGFIERGDYAHGKPMPWGSPSALEPTYWAVRALELLGARPRDPESAGAFVRARRSENGGYDAYEYAFGAAKESLYTTFWAVATLRSLGLPSTDSAKTVEWVRAQQDTDPRGRRGGFSLSNDDWFFASPAGCYYALRTLNLLGSAPARPDSVKPFLLSEYGQEPDGGFETGHHRGWRQNHYSRTEDTYAAVTALELLGKPLSDQDSSRAAHPRSDCIAWLKAARTRMAVSPAAGSASTPRCPRPAKCGPPGRRCGRWRSSGRRPRSRPRPVRPVNEVQPHQVAHRHPCVDDSDPCEVWAYRRIALPIYEHYLAETGSRLAALGMVNRWAAAAVGPHNGAWITGGRGILMHGWGQCGTMSWLFQEMAATLDYPARPSFIIADVNCELLVREDSWEAPHWCLFVPFTYEYPQAELVCPDGQANGWSVLDMVVDYRLRKTDPARPRPTAISDRLFAQVRVETVDPVTGRWGREIAMDSTTTYDDPRLAELYPDRSW